MSDQSNDVQNSGGKMPSRRGFIAKVGGIAAGLAAFIVGNAFATPAAHAATGGELVCCTGPAACSGGRCPSGTHLVYSWYCSTSTTQDWSCDDCYNSSNLLVCVAVNYLGT